MNTKVTQAPNYPAILAILNAMVRCVAEMAANSRVKEEPVN
ncbi:MAG TPA: hypothetical protein VFU31_31340 [Candidatus Binatia bacterium]|nr:hypothetical protein [Candidatus Binatia bacterium]